MLELLTPKPVRLERLSLEQSIGMVGTKLTFSSPESLALGDRAEVRLNGRVIFSGEIEAKRLTVERDNHVTEYGGRDSVTIALDTCLEPRELAANLSIENFLKILAPDLPFEVREPLPKLVKFYLEPGEHVIEQVQRAARELGARSFVSRGKLIVAKRPRASTVTITATSPITSLELEENRSKIFDEVAYIEQDASNRQTKDERRKQKRRKLVRVLPGRSTDEMKRDARRLACEARLEAFRAELALAEWVDIQPLESCTVTLPQYGLTGTFVATAVRYHLGLDEEGTELTLNHPEAFDL